MAEPLPPTASPTPGGPGRLRRVLGAVGKTLGLSTVFTLSLVGAVLLHLDLGPSRRTARMVANDLFAGPDRLFVGRLEVGEIDRLSLRGVTIRRATAYDPTGAQVIDAAGLKADADVMAIVQSAVAGTGDIRVLVPLVHLDHADVALDKGKDGVPTIAEVFLPRVPSPPPPPGSRKPRVTLQRIEIDHVWTHGSIAAPNPVDGELSRAVGHFELTPDGLTVDVEPTKVDVRAPPPRTVTGDVRFSLHGSGPGTAMRIDAGFDGRAGDLDVHTTAQLAGNHVAGRVEVPHATAAAIAAMVPGPPPNIPLRVPVSAVIEAEGELPEIAFKTKLDFEGGGSAKADGTVALRSPVVVDAGLTVKGVDPRVVLDVPKATPVNAKAHVWIEAGKALKIDANATTEAFTLGDDPIPAVDAKAALADGVWKGAVQVDEKGAPLHGTFSFDTRDQKLGFEAETRVASISGIGRVKVPVEGSATVKVKGTLQGRALDATVSAQLGGVRASGGVALSSGQVDVKVTGPLDALGVDATVKGSGLEAGFVSGPAVSVRATGPLLAPKIQADLDMGNGESLSASAAVDAKAKAATGVKLQLNRKGGAIAGVVERVAATPGGVDVEGLSINGKDVGTLQGGLRVVGKEIKGKLRGQDVDLDRVAHLVSLPVHLAGRANLDIDLSTNGPGDRRGHVAVEMVDGEITVPGPKGLMIPVTGVGGVFTATFEGDRVRSDGLFRLVTRAAAGEKPGERCDGAIAQIRVTGGDGKIPGPLLDPRSWQHASGTIEIAADDWNLRCLRRAAGPLVPLDVRGKLTTRITVERDAAARLPTVKSLLVQTRGLEVVADDWESRHIDVKVEGAFNGSTGEAEARVGVLDGDPLDPLASVAVKSTLDLPALLDHPEKRKDSLLHAPVHGDVDIKRRPITAFAGLPSFVTDRLPVLTGQQGDALAGDIELHGTLDGSVVAPRLEDDLRLYKVEQVVVGTRGAQGELRALEKPLPGPWGLPIDADVTTTYDGQSVKLAAKVETGGKAVTTAGAEVKLPIGDLLAGKVRPTGGFHAELDGLPLGSLPLLDDKRIGGKLSGKVEVAGIGDKPSIRVKLAIPGLKVDRIAYDEADLSVDVGAPEKSGAGERGDAKVQLTLKGGNGGSLTTSASQEVTWEDGLVPRLAPGSAAKLDLTAKGFQVGVAEPFVRGAVSRLDGVLDGELHVSYHPGKGTAATRTSLDKVDLRFGKGVLNLPDLGQELHDVGLALVAGEDGKVAIKDVRARGTKGLVTGSGFAKLDGLVLERAEIALDIKQGEELPITLQGVPFGEARGKITLVAQKNGDNLDAKIGLPLLHVDLAPAVGRTAQSMEDNKDVAVLHEKKAEAIAASGGGTTVLTFDPVRIELKGKIQGKVPVEGNIVGKTPIRVVLGGKKAVVSGAVSLPSFKITVLRKDFVIEHGGVTLSPEDVSKSFIKVAAKWDSPEGGPAVIEYEGDLAGLGTNKLTDRLKCSWGSLSGHECLTAVLVGSGQAQGQALASQLLAQEFSTDLGGGISTSFGTGDDGSIRPGVKFKVGPFDTELSTYGAGGGATTTTSGNAAPKGQHSLGTLDYRFWRNWDFRLKVDVGNDQQTFGTDVLWQYRY